MARQRKKRRAHSPHRGVKLVRRERTDGEVWLGRWTDPDTGKPREVSLTKLGYTTHETRRDWAIRKSKAIHQRQQELEDPDARPRTETPLATALEQFYAGARLKPRTLKSYKLATGAFVDWATTIGVSCAEELRPEQLAAFRASLVAATRQKQAAGGRRGERAEDPEAGHSPVTINNRLRPIKTVLRELLRLGLTPRLTRDAIADGLRRMREPKPAPACLSPQELARLLRAALRHDAARHALPEDELDLEAVASTARELGNLLDVHESRVSQLRRADWFPEGPPWRLGDVVEAVRRSGPAKHQPIAPFLVVVLLSGMRFSEALSLRVACLELDARPAGWVRLLERLGVELKTGVDRSVDLAVSPALARLLAALKLRAADTPFVFGGAEPWARSLVEAARKRLVRSYGAPEFTWQTLRATCGSYLTNAPGIYGGASAYRSAAQLGHSVTVAERHYLNAVSVPREATDLETAMEIADLVELVVRQVSGEADVGARVRAG